jgi:hypothetical protein
VLGYLRLFLVNYCLTRETVAVHRRHPSDAQKIIAVKLSTGAMARFHALMANVFSALQAW